MAEATPKPFRWGILGCARVARNHWIGALRATGGARLDALASRDMAKARSWADEFGVPRAYGDYDDLLADGDLDAILIVLPSALHAPWVLRALAAGKHVLCDKPLATSAAAARGLAQAADQAGRLLGEGFVYPYHPQYDLIARWLSEGRIGPLRLIRVGFTIALDRPGDFRFDPALGGGALLDLGCYCVSLIRRLAQTAVRSVSASSRRRAAGVDLATAAVLELDNQITAVFDCALDCRGEQFLQLAGPVGRITADCPFRVNPGARLTLHTASGTDVQELRPVNQYAACIDGWQQRLARDLITPSPAWDAADTLAVLDAVAQSAATGRTVTLS